MTDAETSAAVDAAARWARRFGLGAAGFRRAVVSVARREHRFARSRWSGWRRDVVVRREPSESRLRLSSLERAAPLDPAVIDPWAVEPASLRVETRRVRRCPVCDGEKKHTCAACGGSAVLRCDDCGGRGLVYSPRSRRNVNCRGCRGTGRRRCPCRDGLVKCGECEGRGKVDEWLEVVEEPFAHELASAANPLAEAVRAHAFPMFASALPPTNTWSGPAPEQAPPHLRGELATPPRLDVRRDRLRRIELQVFHGALVAVEYELGGRRGTVLWRAWDGEVQETPGCREPLARRRRQLLAAAVVGAAAGLAIAAAYAARHPIYLQRPSFLVLVGLAPVQALALLPTIAELVLPAAARRWRAALVPLAFVLAAQALVARTGAPSVERAEALRANGATDEALRELRAAVELDREAVRAAQRHDALQLELARDELARASTAWQALTRTYLTTPARETAIVRAIVTVSVAVTAHHDALDLEASRQLLATVPDELSSRPDVERLRRRQHVLVGETCVTRSDADCLDAQLRGLAVLSGGHDDAERLRELVKARFTQDARTRWRIVGSSRQRLAARADACASATTAVAMLEAALIVSEGVPTSDELAVECRRIAAQQVAEEERRQERERLAEQRRRKAALRSWARAPLRCRDGTLSPSCVCGGSRRGCCSWHGGVAGCSQE